MAIIASLHWGIHDSAAAIFDDYKVIAAVQKERLTRIKKDAGDPTICLDEVLSIAGLARADIDVVVFSRMRIPRRMLQMSSARRFIERLNGKAETTADIASRLKRERSYIVSDVVNIETLRSHFGISPTAEVFFSNHHEAHALPALFYTDWQDALLYTADGYGDGVNYSQRIFKDGKLECLFGDDRWLHEPYRNDSIARAYMYVTEALGFKPVHHEGKITGLAAFGNPAFCEEFKRPFSVDDTGVIQSTFRNPDELRDYYFKACEGRSREDCAASIQAAAEQVVVESALKILTHYKVGHIGLAGGLFANVKLNQRLVEESGARGIFIVPPMGDEGLVIGGALKYLLSRDGMEAWLSKRYLLSDVYWGRDFSSESTKRILDHDPRIRALPGDPIALSAELLSKGKVVATFLGRMEYGPRALGARSIMASPHRTEVNDSINKRLGRTEFMPFAPFVAAVDAADVFNVTPANAYACRFMTITCDVKQKWKERIPAVVHVDGTARPQIIERDTNPVYFDILSAFKQLTGLPVLVNTSFNVHEEPIINTPEEAAQALVDGRVDYLITEGAVLGLSAG